MDPVHLLGLWVQLMVNPMARAALGQRDAPLGIHVLLVADQAEVIDGKASLALGFVVVLVEAAIATGVPNIVTRLVVRQLFTRGPPCQLVDGNLCLSLHLGLEEKLVG